MAKKTPPPPPPKSNYDHTAAERVNRQRDGVKAAGGARVEALLDANEVALLDAYVGEKRISSKPVTPDGKFVVESRRAAIRHLVQQLEAPAGKSRKSA